MFVMREYTPAELIDIATKFPGKGQGRYPGLVSAAVGYACDGISLTGREGEKMSSSGRSCMLLGCVGSSRNSLPCRLDYSSCREPWPNEEDLPGHVRHWKSIEEVQQVLRELGMRQAFYTLSLKALIQSHSLQE